MKKSYNVIVKNVTTFSITDGDEKRAFEEFDIVNGLLEKYLRILEKKFNEIIWYIGTDILDDDKITERFMFAKSGFMEIILKKSAEIRAYFPTKKKAEKFMKAFEKTRKEYCKNYSQDILGKAKLYE